ncbi:hypothetical protein [Thermicanus aegyptius]|uniref:hypothetical protein n=1 Tax=Thermicanus aegyptius TaxID=94009 RepID=UPI0003FB8A3B|nr:hypothetical protein [Thermicanus aegyptius]
MEHTLINPLKTIANLISDPTLEEELKKYHPETQKEIFYFLRGIMADEIRFVLKNYPVKPVQKWG